MLYVRVSDRASPRAAQVTVDAFRILYILNIFKYHLTQKLNKFSTYGILLRPNRIAPGGIKFGRLNVMSQRW